MGVRKLGDRLREKLKELMPKNPKPKEDGVMLRFDPQPIRRSAEAFAHAIDFELPTDREELLALLWVFGECLNGHMERQMVVSNKLVEDALATKINPIYIVNRGDIQWPSKL